MRVRSRIVRLLGLLAVLWLAGVPASLYAQAATPTPAPVLTGRRVVKEVCRSLLGYDSVEALKRDLEIVAKREAANELFGELIVASITVQNWTVTEDQLRSQSLGLVRVEGSPDFRNGSNVGDVCVTLTVYATARDFARFEPQTIVGRSCVSGADLTLRQARATAEESAWLQALINYDRRLARYDPVDISSLLRQVTYPESDVAADTDSYCATVQGTVIPVEVDGFLALWRSQLVTNTATPDQIGAAIARSPRPTATSNWTRTATARVNLQATAIAATLTTRPTATPDTAATETKEARLVATAVAATLTAAPTVTSTPRPTSTATPQPPPATLPTVAAAPSLSAPTVRSCNFSADTIFSGLYQSFQDELGCPTSVQFTVSTISEQMFEGGHLFWRKDTDIVYIIYDRNKGGGELYSGTWDKSIDPTTGRYWSWASVGEPDANGVGLTPPPGRYEPVRGFGWLWRTHLGRENGPLGWALDRAYGFDNVAQVQNFENGVMFKGSDPKQYILLHNGQFYAQ